jgi:ArsR family metal-binding transcriptional regulator
MIFRYIFDKILPCIADPTKIRVIIKIGRDHSGLFPYMKGYLKKGIYLKDLPSFSFKKEGKNIAIYRDSIAITKLNDEHEVIRELRSISSLIQDVILKKGKTEPDYSSGRDISPGALYKLLPKTNCKQCGEETCLVFALKLINNERVITECIPLFTEGFKNERGLMLNQLTEYGFDIPMAAFL